MKQLTIKQRYYIETELKHHVKVSVIAKKLGYNESTIYKEIKKGLCEQITQGWSGRKEMIYKADYAQMKHDEKASKKGRKRKLLPDDTFLRSVSDKIVNGKYYPEAAFYSVAGANVCIKTVYNYIHAGYMQEVTINNLPYARKKKKKKQTVAKKLPRGKSIEERPKYINDRTEYGHWEIDTVYSSRDDKTCLLTLTERMKREEIIFKIPNRTASSVTKCLDRLERKLGSKVFREKFKTITADNGVEFSDFVGMERSIRNKRPRTQIYFAHPYSSWERGSNENRNRMIRRWIPKGDDFGLYSDEEIQQICDWINNYPLRLLGWKSPLQI